MEVCACAGRPHIFRTAPGIDRFRVPCPENDVLEFHGRHMWPCIAYWGGGSRQTRWGTARPPRWDCQMLVSACTPSAGPCDLVLSEQWARDFHDFSFVWTETALDFFLDGVHINHVHKTFRGGSIDPRRGARCASFLLGAISAPWDAIERSGSRTSALWAMEMHTSLG